MKRFLVIFYSHHERDPHATAVDVTAASPLAAIAKAKHEAPPHHEWQLVSVMKWPRGCANVDDAFVKLAIA